jgi:alpha 1,3-glucosidase
VDNAEVYDGNGFVDISVTIDAIPVYYRRGSVILRKETVRLSSDEMANDGYTLYVNLDADNKASGTVYLDDNTSFNYVDNKEYNYLKIDMDGSDVTLTKIDEDSNSDNFDFIIDQVVVNKLIKEPENGKPGRYEQKLYKRDASQNLLKNLKFKFDKPAKVKLV